MEQIKVDTIMTHKCECCGARWNLGDNQWVSIDLAPKDGDDILTLCDDYQIVCHWNNYVDDGSSWCSHAFGKEKGWYDRHDEIHYPTHWIPLPTPPKENYETTSS